MNKSRVWCSIQAFVGAEQWTWIRIVVVDVCWLKIMSLNSIFSTFHILWNEVNLEIMNINRYLQLKRNRTAKIMILPFQTRQLRL